MYYVVLWVVCGLVDYVVVELWAMCVGVIMCWAGEKSGNFRESSIIGENSGNF